MSKLSTVTANEKKKQAAKQRRDGMSKRLGHCYDLSAKYVIDHPDAILVHGNIVPPPAIRAEVHHKSLDHAWVEYTRMIESRELAGPCGSIRLGVALVYDPVMDREYPREYYYNTFGATVFSAYSWEDSAKLMRRTGHFGPWHEEKAA